MDDLRYKRESLTQGAIRWVTLGVLALAVGFAIGSGPAGDAFPLGHMLSGK